MTGLTFDAILFDLDGVLVDSKACIEHHWRLWAVRHALDVEALMTHLHGRRMVEVIRQHAPHLAAEEEAARLAEEEGRDTNGVYEVDGAADLLRSLPPRAWAIVTSGNHLTATTRIRHTGLPAPPVLVTADDVRHGKPHPEPYLTAARMLGYPPSRCLVIEDAPAGIESAHAAGMRAVGLTTTHTATEMARSDTRTARLADVVLRVVGTHIRAEIAT